ncbi:MAG: hypothetical protein EU536_00995 [Promethearchaeota archaeon]|nr:MAG: hypothetical protein EU536_00995 [Candidatus Lokiarchaeota archaeon]
MGRTVPSFRMALEQEIALWHPFRKALRPKDREVFDQVMVQARNHSDAGMLANRPIILDVIFMAVLLEQQKKIERLQQQLSHLKKERLEEGPV